MEPQRLVTKTRLLYAVLFFGACVVGHYVTHEPSRWLCFVIAVIGGTALQLSFTLRDRP